MADLHPASTARTGREVPVGSGILKVVRRVRGPERSAMSINLWGWREGGAAAVRLGLSEGAAGPVMDLAAVGVDGIEDLWDLWAERGLPGLRALLERRPERRPLPADDLVFPVPVSEIWGAGVTYERSREAREAESEGFRALYRLVYDAPRPEIFFK